MKRWPLRILFCLLLGAITTVAVAWGGARGLPRHNSDSTEHSRAEIESHDLQTWRSHMMDGWPEEPGTGVVAHRLFWERRSIYLHSAIVTQWDSSWEQVRSERDFYDGHGIFRIETVMTGFPMRALGARWWRSSPQAAHLFPEAIGHNGWEFDQTLFPTRILWPGFVIDTLFYAAIWFGVFFGFASAKRAIRRKRGRCPRCGYDLRGALDNGCSECGWDRE